MLCSFKGCMKCSVVSVVLLAIVVRVLWPPALPTKEYNFAPYDPTLSTDIKTRMLFVPDDFSGSMIETNLYGFSYDLHDRVWRHLLSFVGKEEYIDNELQKQEDAKIPVSVTDARKLSTSPSLDIEGFELFSLADLSVEEQTSMTYAPLKPKIEAYLRAQYPEVKDFVWTYEVTRLKATNYDGQTQARTEGGPHLDYSADHNATREYYERYPGVLDAPQLIVEGHPTNPDLKLMKLLGIWKPTNMKTPVCQHSLAIMDARTLKPEDHINSEVHLYLDAFGLLNIFNSIAGALKYSPEHKWFYYPHQTIQEVLLFTQWSPRDFFATPHTGIVVENCPEEFEDRISVESRIGLFV